MITLAIETSNPSASPPGVALADDQRIIAEELLRMDEPGVEDLVPTIDRVVCAKGLAPRDIARVAVSIGPGGYTSVRVAVTVAKMIALAMGCECVGVPTALVGAVRTRLDGRGDRPFAIALASKGETAFIATFASPDVGEEGRLCDASGLHELGVSRLLADRFFPDAMRASALELGIEVLDLRLGAAACAVASRGLTGGDPAVLAPIYPRPPEAVRLWRARTAR